MKRIALALFSTWLTAALAPAQIHSEVVVSGLVQPLAFVQDPSDSTVQYIVEQGGRIRVLKGGVLQATSFLDLSTAVAAGGERGLLGLAFPPDYASSGRFYVNFTDTRGDTVVARFKRSTATALVADPASRFDLQWPSGERVIRQPFANHNGGNLVFGPDGLLYLGMGDGGSSDDPSHRAQDPRSLLGKMLRIDVGVPDTDARGYRVPPDNPFTSTGPAGTLGEIWAFGLRNPWRFAFDDPRRGGTGALVIADVGQNTWEEINYEPANRGGRNYGWRNREGAHDNVTTLPPAYRPLTEPIFEYGHAEGQSITGGTVYRGTDLGPRYGGRYFFADFVAGRVWSLALTVNPPTREATASDLVEHTAELGGTAALGSISSFGVDATGELYVVNWSDGRILRMVGTGTSGGRSATRMFVDSPTAGAVTQPFDVSGWAFDANATSGTGIDAVHVWAHPLSGGRPMFLGAARYGAPRPDIGVAFGDRFTLSGYNLTVAGLTPGDYQIVVYAHSAVSGEFSAVRVVRVRVR